MNQPKEHKNIVEIHRHSQGWRAVLRLPLETAKWPGVMGGMTDRGPWLSGDGYSPDSALREAARLLGEAYLRSIQPEPEPENQLGEVADGGH